MQWFANNLVMPTVALYKEIINKYPIYKDNLEDLFSNIKHEHKQKQEVLQSI